jgi:hypothetical protein
MDTVSTPEVARLVDRDVKIFVNTRPHTVPPGEVTFEQVVAFAFPAPPPGQWEYTVTYRNGSPGHPKGSLLPGKSVPVREGMIFNVSATDKS